MTARTPEQVKHEELRAKYASIDPSLRETFIEMDLSQWREARERRAREEEASAAIEQAWSEATEQQRARLLDEFGSLAVAKREHHRRTRPRAAETTPRLGARLHGMSTFSRAPADQPAPAAPRWDYR
jgi:hypothetical protein